MPAWIRPAVFCGFGLAALLLIPSSASAQVRVGVFVGGPVVAAPVVVAPRVVAPVVPYYPAYRYAYSPHYYPYAYGYPYGFAFGFSYGHRYYAPRGYAHRGGFRR